MSNFDQSFVEIDDSVVNLRTTALLAEYVTLRQEILQNQLASQQVLGFFLSLALLGAALAAPTVDAQLRPWLFNIGAALLASLALSQIVRRGKTFYIGAYIAKVIEPQIPGLSWQTAWFRQARESRGRLFRQHFVEVLPLLIPAGSFPFAGYYYASGGIAADRLWVGAYTLLLLGVPLGALVGAVFKDHASEFESIRLEIAREKGICKMARCRASSSGCTQCGGHPNREPDCTHDQR